MSDDKHNVEEHEYTIQGYIFGFILAVILTLLSFIPVMNDTMHNWTISGKIIYLLGMAFIQILVQSYYFLHLQHGDDADWKVGTYIFGLSAATIVVGGSWWAIQHLNYNMMGGSGRIVTPSTIIQHDPEVAKPISMPTTLHSDAANKTVSSSGIPTLMKSQSLSGASKAANTSTSVNAVPLDKSPLTIKLVPSSETIKSNISSANTTKDVKLAPAVNNTPSDAAPVVIKIIPADASKSVHGTSPESTKAHINSANTAKDAKVAPAVNNTPSDAAPIAIKVIPADASKFVHNTLPDSTKSHINSANTTKDAKAKGSNSLDALANSGNKSFSDGVFVKDHVIKSDLHDARGAENNIVSPDPKIVNKLSIQHISSNKLIFDPKLVKEVEPYADRLKNIKVSNVHPVIIKTLPKEVSHALFNMVKATNDTDAKYKAYIGSKIQTESSLKNENNPVDEHIIDGLNVRVSKAVPAKSLLPTSVAYIGPVGSVKTENYGLSTQENIKQINSNSVDKPLVRPLEVSEPKADEVNKIHKAPVPIAVPSQSNAVTPDAQQVAPNRTKALDVSVPTSSNVKDAQQQDTKPFVPNAHTNNKVDAVSSQREVAAPDAQQVVPNRTKALDVAVPTSSNVKDSQERDTKPFVLNAHTNNKVDAVFSQSEVTAPDAQQVVPNRTKAVDLSVPTSSNVKDAQQQDTKPFVPNAHTNNKVDAVSSQSEVTAPDAQPTAPNKSNDRDRTKVLDLSGLGN